MIIVHFIDIFAFPTQNTSLFASWRRRGALSLCTPLCNDSNKDVLSCLPILLKELFKFCLCPFFVWGGSTGQAFPSLRWRRRGFLFLPALWDIFPGNSSGLSLLLPVSQGIWKFYFPLSHILEEKGCLLFALWLFGTGMEKERRRWRLGWLYAAHHTTTTTFHPSHVLPAITS